MYIMLGFHKLYAPPNITTFTKQRKMRWACHVARMRGIKIIHKLFEGKPEGKATTRKSHV